MSLESALVRHEVKSIGAVDYQVAYELQKRLQFQRVNGTIPDTTLLLTHPSVYTMGNAPMDTQKLIREQLPAPLHMTDRGGKITYHGPGQLVVYFIHRIPESVDAVKRFADDVENISLTTLRALGVECYSRKDEKDAYDKPIRGAWVSHQGTHRKIAAQGIGTNRYSDVLTQQGYNVTLHGLALNVTTDLSYFEKIKACGFEDNIMINMQTLLGKHTPDFARVQDIMRNTLQTWSFAHHE